jgi:hypothetical protein
MKYVGMYTGRELSKTNDILAAFGGISWLLEEYLQSTLLYGIPVSHFDLALLWTLCNGLVRRRSITKSENDRFCRQDDHGNCVCNQRTWSAKEKEFPSWSWYDWMSGSAGYLNGSIEGCLLNVQSWLKHHTWIKWHVRDGFGHLRSLHHPISSEDRYLRKKHERGHERGDDHDR